MRLPRQLDARQWVLNHQRITGAKREGGDGKLHRSGRGQVPEAGLGGRVRRHHPGPKVVREPHRAAAEGDANLGVRRARANGGQRQAVQEGVVEPDAKACAQPRLDNPRSDGAYSAFGEKRRGGGGGVKEETECT